MIVDRYLYGKLTESEKSAYREIYKGCLEHKEVIQITESEDFLNSYERITQAVTDDNPLLYFVNQSMIEVAKDAYGNAAVMPQYFFSPEQSSAYNQKIQDAVNKIIYDLGLTECTEIEKVRKVHDYLCKNISYDYEGSDAKNTTRLIASHSIIGVFAHKKAQCEGIAKAAKVLLNAVDVRCIFVRGILQNTDGSMINHGWNIVNIDGAPYHIDITSDIGVGSPDMIAYDYLNVTDAQIRQDHILNTGYPICSEKAAHYFVQNNLVFSSKRKLKDYVVTQARNGERIYYFKLAGRLKAAEICDEILNVAYQNLPGSDSADLKGYTLVNEAMNTCRITFR